MLCVCLGSLSAQPQLHLVPLVSGLTQPVDMVHAGDERIFVVEQPGIIRVIDGNGNLLPQPFLDISIRVNSSGNERGLLGLAFHPDYATNGYLYVNYTGNGGATYLARYQVSANDANRAEVSSEQVLLTISQPFSNHNAGDLAFGPDGYLYVPTGDGGSGGDPQDHGQDLSSLLGKILRLDVDGGDPYAIPADNPFAGDPNARDEIWSYGWRNPWRISFDRQTGDLWVGDVGQNDFEEINYEPAGTPGGRNYGWHCYEGEAPFNFTGCAGGSFTSPIFDYAHGQARSVTGGFVYRGSQYPGLQGHYLFGDYMNGQWWAMRPDGNGGWQVFDLGTLDGIGRFDLSTLGEGADGELYVAAHSAGEVWHIEETSATQLSPHGEAPLQLKPQPWQTTLILARPAQAIGPLRVRLLDGQGRSLRSWDLGEATTHRLARPELAAGLYLLELQDQRHIWRSKVLLR